MAAVRAYAMRQPGLAAVRAGAEARVFQFPVRPALLAARAGMSSFGNRHAANLREEIVVRERARARTRTALRSSRRHSADTGHGNPAVTASPWDVRGAPLRALPRRDRGS